MDRKEEVEPDGREGQGSRSCASLYLQHLLSQVLEKENQPLRQGSYLPEKATGSCRFHGKKRNDYIRNKSPRIFDMLP